MILIILKQGLRVFFDKVFSSRRDIESAILLFLKILTLATDNKNYHLNSNSLLSLFRAVLLRHEYKSLKSFTAFWFVYQCMFTRVIIESELIATSRKHLNFWQVYKEIIHLIQDKEFTTYDILLNITNQIFLLEEDSRTLAYNNVKTCFIPLSAEDELFKKIYKEKAINKQLMKF